MALVATLYRTDDDRQAERHAVEVDATLRDPADAPLDTIVLDLSTTGFRATVSGTMPPGTTVRLGLPGLGVNAATVVWQSGSVIGCQFDRPIPADGIARAQSTTTVVAAEFATDATVRTAPAQAAGKPRLMAAGMPFPAAFAISTLMSVAWASSMLQLVQTTFIAPLAG